MLTDGAVRQFSGREFQSLGAATEKRRAAVSKLCGGTDRNFCVDDRGPATPTGAGALTFPLSLQPAADVDIV